MRRARSCTSANKGCSALRAETHTSNDASPAVGASLGWGYALPQRGGRNPPMVGGAQLRFLSKPLARLRDGPLSPQWRPQRPSLRPPPCSVRRCPGIALRPTARTTGHEPHTSRVTERGRLTFSRKDDYGRGASPCCCSSPCSSTCSTAPARGAEEERNNSFAPAKRQKTLLRHFTAVSSGGAG